MLRYSGSVVWKHCGSLQKQNQFWPNQGIAGVQLVLHSAAGWQKQRGERSYLLHHSFCHCFFSVDQFFSGFKCWKACYFCPEVWIFMFFLFLHLTTCRYPKALVQKQQCQDSHIEQKLGNQKTPTPIGNPDTRGTTHFLWWGTPPNVKSHSFQCILGLKMEEGAQDQTCRCFFGLGPNDRFLASARDYLDGADPPTAELFCCPESKSWCPESRVDAFIWLQQWNTRNKLVTVGLNLVQFPCSLGMIGMVAEQFVNKFLYEKRWTVFLSCHDIPEPKKRRKWSLGERWGFQGQREPFCYIVQKQAKRVRPLWDS